MRIFCTVNICLKFVDINVAIVSQSFSGKKRLIQQIDFGDGHFGKKPFVPFSPSPLS